MIVELQAWQRAGDAADKIATALDALLALTLLVSPDHVDPDLGMWDQEAREAYQRGRREMAAELATVEIGKARAAVVDLVEFLEVHGAG